MNLIKLFKKFPTKESCVEYIEKIRWADGITCPYCESKKTHKHINRHQCNQCWKSFSVTVGTIFHHTHLDLRYWFYIISLMINAKKSLSACQVARDLDMRRTTAWEVMHKIRKAMQTEQKELLTGIFEMDETYIKADKSKEDKDDEDNNKFGGNMGRSLKNNTPIVGIKQKGGDIKAFATENTKYHTLGKIAMSIADLGSEFHTDEYSSYRLFKKFFNHKTVNRSIEYVNKKTKVHCNSVEGFWSLFKRGIKGQFHHISKKYLQHYINEFSYRYNARDVATDVVFGDVVKRMLFV